MVQVFLCLLLLFSSSSHLLITATKVKTAPTKPSPAKTTPTKASPAHTTPSSSTLFIDDHEIQPFPHEVPNCYSLRNSKSTVTSVHCLPSVLVAGFRKCGTSALYGFLSLHPSTIGTVRKEHCIGKGTIVTYLKTLPTPKDIEGKILISGCLYFETLREMLRLKPTSMKVLLTIRDYAERAWAAYNFWCLPQVDGCPEFTITTKADYRSPEMFHEIVLAQVRNLTLNLWLPTLLREAPRYYRDNIHQYAAVIPPQDLHVIHSKELETSPEVVWKGIAKFVNHSLISPSAPHPQIKLFQSRRYNTQQHKGSANFQSSKDYTGESYSITGNRPMLPETREIITERWKPDCLWLKETYNFTTLEAC
jgi:hypothetical protein